MYKSHCLVKVQLIFTVVIHGLPQFPQVNVWVLPSYKAVTICGSIYDYLSISFDAQPLQFKSMINRMNKIWSSFSFVCALRFQICIWVVSLLWCEHEIYSGFIILYIHRIIIITGKLNLWYILHAGIVPWDVFQGQPNTKLTLLRNTLR
jgi:hypothetical protein